MLVLDHIDFFVQNEWFQWLDMYVVCIMSALVKMPLDSLQYLRQVQQVLCVVGIRQRNQD